MQTIFKYQLNPDHRAVSMPKGAKILTVGEQNSQIFIWALVNPDNPKVDRVFSVYGTGHDAPTTPTTVYVGTVMLLGGNLVFHVFEETNP